MYTFAKSVMLNTQFWILPFSLNIVRNVSQVATRAGLQMNPDKAWCFCSQTGELCRCGREGSRQLWGPGEDCRFMGLDGCGGSNEGRWERHLREQKQQGRDSEDRLKGSARLWRALLAILRVGDVGRFQTLGRNLRMAFEKDCSSVYISPVIWIGRGQSGGDFQSYPGETWWELEPELAAMRREERRGDWFQRDVRSRKGRS